MKADTTTAAITTDIFDTIRRTSTTPSSAISVLDAVTITLTEQQHSLSPTAYFGSMVTMLERPEINVDLVEGITFILSTLLQSGRVSGSVIIAKFNNVTGVLLRALQVHAESAIGARHILLCLNRAMSYVDRNVWANPNAARVLQALLVFAVDPRPKVRRTAQTSVMSLLRSLAPNVPSVVADCIRLSCRRELDNADVSVTLHLMGLLQSMIEFLPLATIAVLVEMFHAKASCSDNKMVKLRLIQCLTTLLELSDSDPTPSFVETVLSAVRALPIHANDHDANLAVFRAMTSGFTLLHRCSATAAAHSLPRYFQSLSSSLLHQHTQIAAQAAASMTTLLTTCIDRTATTDLVVSLVQTAESLLSYRFKSHWTTVLPIVSAAVASIGKRPDALSLTSSLLKSLDAILLAADAAVTYKQREAIRAVMLECVTHLGAAAILSVLSIEWPLRGDSASLQTFLASSRVWLLPMIKTATSATTSLLCFRDRLVPAAADLFDWMHATSQPVERQSLNAIVLQIWECFPAFCSAPNDSDAVLADIVPALCTALERCTEARIPIARGLSAVLSAPSPPSQPDLVAKSLLPALFTTITLLAPDKRQPLLDCTKSWCAVASTGLVNRMFMTVVKRLLSATDDVATRHNMLDLCNATCSQLDDDNRQRLMSIIERIVMVGDDVFAQKRAYQCWRQLLVSGWAPDPSAALSQFTSALSSLAGGAMKARLLCIPPLCALVPDDQIQAAIPEVLGECILAVKQANFKVRDAAYGTIVALGDRVEIAEFVMMLLGGLAGTAQMQSASVLALARFMFEKRAVVSKEIVEQILDTLLLLFENNSQEVMRAVLAFIKVAVVSLTPDLLRPHLKAILSGLELWANQNKNRFRQKWRHILERMLRRFSFEELNECIPASYQPFLNSIQKSKKKSKNKKPKANLSYENILDEDDEEEVGEVGVDPSARNLRGDGHLKLVHSVSEPLDLSNLSHSNVVTVRATGKKRKASDDKAVREHLGKLVIDGESDDDVTGKRPVAQKTKIPRTDQRDHRRKPTLTKKKQAGGDVRKKGDKFEPFTYQPLHPHALSRRHQTAAKHSFKALVGKRKK